MASLTRFLLLPTKCALAVGLTEHILEGLRGGPSPAVNLGHVGPQPATALPAGLDPVCSGARTQSHLGPCPGSLGSQPRLTGVSEDTTLPGALGEEMLRFCQTALFSS